MAKRFSLGLVAVGLTTSLSIYAAVPTGAAPFQVYIPNLSPGFEFGVAGLLLEPTDNYEDYTVIVNTSPLTMNTYDVRVTNPGYDFGFALGIGYIFPCSGNDIRLAWERFHQSSTDSVTVDEESPEITQPLFNTDFDSDLNQASATQDFEYDAVDLDVGQFVDIGTRLHFRILAGVRYAHLDRDFSAHYTALIDPGVDFLDTDYNSKFDGVGPLFGVDSVFHLGNCLGLAGHLNSALLIGRVQTSDTFTTPLINNTSAAVLVNDTATLTADNETRVVPGVDARLGLDWSFPFIASNCDDGLFSVELGWQVVHYFNAVDTITPITTSAILTTAVVVNNLERQTSDVAFNGPYLSLNLKL